MPSDKLLHPPYILVLSADSSCWKSLLTFGVLFVYKCPDFHLIWDVEKAQMCSELWPVFHRGWYQIKQWKNILHFSDWSTVAAVAEQQPQHMEIILLLLVFKAGEVHCDAEGPETPLHEAVLGGKHQCESFPWWSVGQCFVLLWHSRGVHGTSISSVVRLDRRPHAGCVKTQINENTD